MQNEFEDRVRELVESTRLSKREAEVYVLYVEASDDLYATHKDVADELGIAPGNCRSKLSSAKAKANVAGDKLDELRRTAELFP